MYILKPRNYGLRAKQLIHGNFQGTFLISGVCKNDTISVNLSILSIRMHPPPSTNIGINNLCEEIRLIIPRCIESVYGCSFCRLESLPPTALAILTGRVRINYLINPQA